MLTNFTSLNQQTPAKLESKYNLQLLKNYDWGSEYAFFSCACGHIHYTTPCSFQFCFCDTIIQGEFKITTEIKLVDIFFFERLEHSLYDSPNFWLEFDEFMKERNNVSIL